MGKKENNNTGLLLLASLDKPTRERMSFMIKICQLLVSQDTVIKEKNKLCDQINQLIASLDTVVRKT